jgi:hypothetical protein
MYSIAVANLSLFFTVALIVKSFKPVFISTCHWREEDPMRPLTPPTIPPPTTQGTHDLGNGIYLEWLNDGRIALFDIHKNTREATATYVEALLALITTWPTADPLLLLIMANRQGAEITRYFRERLSEVNTAVGEQNLTGRIAIVVKRDIFVQVAKGILRVQQRLVKTQMPTQFFFERDEALGWLEKLSVTRT